MLRGMNAIYISVGVSHGSHDVTLVLSMLVLVSLEQRHTPSAGTRDGVGVTIGLPGFFTIFFGVYRLHRWGFRSAVGCGERVFSSSRVDKWALAGGGSGGSGTSRRGGLWFRLRFLLVPDDPVPVLIDLSSQVGLEIGVGLTGRIHIKGIS